MKATTLTRLALILAAGAVIGLAAPEADAGGFSIRVSIGSSVRSGPYGRVSRGRDYGHNYVSAGGYGHHRGARYVRHHRGGARVHRPIRVTRPLRRVIVLSNTAAYPNRSVVYVVSPAPRQPAVVYASPRRSSRRTAAGTTTHRRR